MPEDIILCTIDIVSPHPNILHEDRLAAMQKALDAREDKTVSEYILKNNIFEHNTSLHKQLRGTAIGTKMDPPYAIIFMGDSEEKFLQEFDKKYLTWW